MSCNLQVYQPEVQATTCGNFHGSDQLLECHVLFYESECFNVSGLSHGITALRLPGRAALAFAQNGNLRHWQDTSGTPRKCIRPCHPVDQSHSSLSLN